MSQRRSVGTQTNPLGCYRNCGDKNSYNQSRDRRHKCKVGHRNILARNPLVAVWEIVFVDGEQDVVKLLNFLLIYFR